MKRQLLMMALAFVVFWSILALSEHITMDDVHDLFVRIWSAT